MLERMGLTNSIPSLFLPSAESAKPRGPKRSFLEVLAACLLAVAFVPVDFGFLRLVAIPKLVFGRTVFQSKC